MNLIDAQWRAARSSGLGVTIYAVAGSATYDELDVQTTIPKDEPVATCLEEDVAEHIVALHNRVIEGMAR
jgi:hypothetical protein